MQIMSFIKSLQGSVLISNDTPERYYYKNGKAYEGNISVKNDILVQKEMYFPRFSDKTSK